MNPTTHPDRRSFIEVDPESDFSIQNLPYGVFVPDDAAEPRVGVAIGEHVLDLAVLETRGLLRTPMPAGEPLFSRASLNAFAALGPSAWQAIRAQIERLLDADVPTLRDDAALRAAALWPRTTVRMRLPFEIGDYTDFYAGWAHVRNVARIFRGPEADVPPQYVHLPIGYHGRASSIVVSGTDIRRPRGQYRMAGADAPVFGATRELDYELEVGFFIGPGNVLGCPIPTCSAPDQIFGLVLVNDWSARDVQQWEYAPLGPFLGKNFATTISPWVVPWAALEPFRCAGMPAERTPLPYLQTTGPQSLDLNLEVALQSARGTAPQVVCRTHFRELYWSPAQMIAHHTVGGCNLRPGDLLATGTISGSTRESCGSLLERTVRGADPLVLADGERRTFLEDGDRVTLRGWCAAEGYRVGFGECTGRVLPALTEADPKRQEQVCRKH